MAYQSRRKLQLTVQRLTELRESDEKFRKETIQSIADESRETRRGLKAFFKLHPRMADAYMLDNGWGEMIVDIDQFLLDCLNEVEAREVAVAEAQRKARLKSGKLEETHG